MGFIYGAATFARYMVDGKVPQDYLEWYPKRIARYAFRKLDESSPEERSIGWANIMDPFDTSFEQMEFLKEPYIAMVWRMDVRRIPKTALNEYCLEKENEIKAAEGLSFLPKVRRRDIREAVRGSLLKRAIPVSKTYDMIWNMNTKVVLFGSVSNRVCDEFMEFFLKTFDLPLRVLFPYELASQALGREDMDHDLLDACRETKFTGGD